MNCGDILVCVECGNKFDEEESPHVFFCSDTCKAIFTLKTWREAQIKILAKKMEDKE